MTRGQPKPRGWSFIPGKPIVRGYDTGALFRDDCLLHIQHLQVELEADMKRIKAEKEYAAAEEQLRKRKKEFGWIDEHSLINTIKANGGPGLRPPLVYQFAV